MKILLDGLFVLSLNKAPVLFFFLSALGWGGWITRFLDDPSARPGKVRLSLSLSLGGILLVLLSFVLIIAGRIWQLSLDLGAAAIPLLGLILVFSWMGSERRPDTATLLIFTLLIAAGLVIRLVFLRTILLPPYDDSPEHYLIVQNFLHPGAAEKSFYALETLLSHYYHFGFHSLAAWMSIVAGLGPAVSIPLTGQLLLVILPFSVFGLLQVVTGDDRAAFVAAWFAGFAWRMPAFTANWGKYPALASAAFFPVVLALWLYQLHLPRRQPASWFIIAAASVGLVFVHTRMAICLALAAASHVLGNRIPLPGHLRFRYVALLAVLPIGALMLFWKAILVFYASGLYLPLVAIAFLVPFSFKAYPRITLSVSIYALLFWIASRSPIFLNGYQAVLFDEPFVQMMLFVPLSLLAGTGCAGMLKQVKLPLRGQIFLAVLMLVGLAGFVSAGVLEPDPCCNYVKKSDLAAIRWLDQNIPSSAVVWTAAFQPRRYMIGTDAGVWVYALTGRNANKLVYRFDWGGSDARDQICQAGYADVFIYQGNTQYSFNEGQLKKQKWLVPVFTSEAAAIYRVREGCNDPD